MQTTENTHRKSVGSVMLFGALCLSLVGCTTAQVVSPGTPALVLKHAETRSLGAGSITVPAGRYEPDFQAKDGVYYLAPTKLVGKVLGMSILNKGGIYVPNPSAPGKTKDMRFGVWYDEQDRGSWVGLTTTSPKTVHYVDVPFDFEVESTANQK